MKTSKILTIAVVLFIIIGIGFYYLGFMKSGLKKVRFAYFPILEEAPAYVAYEKGFWEERGLNISFIEIHGGAEGIYVLTGKEAEISGATATDIIYAVARGIKLKILCAVASDDPKDPQHAILVLNDSPIYNVSDLKGKTIGIFKYGNIDDIILRVYLKKNGLEPEKDVNIIEIPLPNLLDSLLSRSVDAIITLEPFKTFALDTGKVRVLSYYMNETIGEVYFAYQIALEDYVEKNKDVISKFLAGYYEGVDYAITYPNDTAEITSKYTGVPIDVITRSSPIIWPKGIDDKIVNNLKEIYNLMKEYGFLDNETIIDIESLFHQYNLKNVYWNFKVDPVNGRLELMINIIVIYSYVNKMITI